MTEEASWSLTPPSPPPAPPPPFSSSSPPWKPRPSNTKEVGLGLTHDHGAPSIHDHGAPSIHEHHDYDIHTGISDSPQRRVSRGPDTHRTTDSMSSLLSPDSANSSVTNFHGFAPPQNLYSPATPQTATPTDAATFAPFDGGTAAATVTNPFNFTPVQYERSPSIGFKSEVLKGRRGHKYKHSSIHASHMDSMFKPPAAAPRTPLSVPASLPMPTRKELWRSMTQQQTVRAYWCACHFLIAGYVQFGGAGSLAMTALSRLLLFDAAGATVCVVVDVMGNFEVWKRSSIKHPFGLERADVLAGFGMAVFIAFMGLDVVSHGFQHALENVGSHVAHSPHAHGRVGAAHVDVASLLSIASTLISAVLLKNHARIGKAMRFQLLAGWGRILGNPSHFLTLSCSLLLLALPFLPPTSYNLVDFLLSLLIALLMVALGARLAIALASMLLMSIRPPPTDPRALRRVVDDIANCDRAVTHVDEARFWQVHYGLCMANLKLRYRKSRIGYGLAAADDLVRIRNAVTECVKTRIGGVLWDVSVQLTIETE